jgi:hypothetical protein
LPAGGLGEYPQGDSGGLGRGGGGEVAVVFPIRKLSASTWPMFSPRNAHFQPLKDREAAFGAHTAAREKCHGRNVLPAKSICTKFPRLEVDTAYLAGVSSCSSPTQPAGDVRLER